MKKLLVLGLAAVTFLSANFAVSAAGLKDVFSGEYYADTYADVKEAVGNDTDALYNHVVTFGLSEKRVMSPVLDVVAYRERYADLDAAFGDDWDAYVEHWFTHGINEGREDFTKFDVKLYVEKYADIREAYGEDWEKVVRHYLTYGIAEGREIGVEKPVAVVSVVSEPVEEVTLSATEYNEDGKVIRETYVYSDGSAAYDMLYSYDESGNLSGTLKVKDMNEIMHSVSYYANGIKKSEGVHDVNGKLYMMTSYYENGQIESKMVFTPDGGIKSLVSYYSNGNIKHESNSDSSGQFLSVMKQYSEDGRLQFFVEMYPGTNNLKTYVTYYEDGVMKSFTEFYEDEVPKIEVTNYENGQRSYEATYSEDGSVLNVKEWDEDGNLIES